MEKAEGDMESTADSVLKHSITLIPQIDRNFLLSFSIREKNISRTPSIDFQLSRIPEYHIFISERDGYEPTSRKGFYMEPGVDIHEPGMVFTQIKAAIDK